MLPTFDPQTKDLQLAVTADVSDLTPPASTKNDIPGRQTATMQTLVHLKLGQSLILSGIHTRRQRHNVGGIPLLNEIPILSLFFGSHTDDFEEVEGSVFIIPSILEPSTRPAFDLVKEAMTQYEDYSGNIDTVQTYPKRPKTDPNE